MTECPAGASSYAEGRLQCMLADDHTGKHWDRDARVWWSVEVTYDTEDD